MIGKRNEGAPHEVPGPLEDSRTKVVEGSGRSDGSGGNAARVGLILLSDSLRAPPPSRYLVLGRNYY